MKIKLLILLNLLLISLSAYSASFDCATAVNKTEKIICNQKLLGKLDEDLMDYYSKIKKTLADEDSNAFIKEQRKWIKNRNAACEKSDNAKDCLELLYSERLDTLKIRYEEPLLPKANEVEKICSELVSLKPDARKNYGSGKPALDINNDGFDDITKDCGGTAHYPCSEYKNSNGTMLDISNINYEKFVVSEDDQWKFDNFHGRKSFNKNGRNYFLLSYDEDFKKPRYISYVTPNNNEYVVCEFDNSESESLEPNQNIKDASEICNSFQNGKMDEMEYITLDEEPVMTSDEVREIGMIETGLIRQGYVDYNNDGFKNYVGEFQLTSGRGRGCAFNFFDELMPDGKSLIQSRTRDLLKEMQGDHCGFMNNKLFKYKGNVYYELNTGKEHNIAFIENAKIKNVCTLNKTIITQVKTIQPYK